MKVKNRLSLQFTLMFGVLLIAVLTGIYLSVEQNRRENFYAKLDYRALIVGELYLAQDNMSGENFRKVIQTYPQTLSHEITRIYNDKFQSVFIREDSVSWSNSNLKNIRSSLRFIQGDTLPAQNSQPLRQIIRQVIAKKKIHYAVGNQQVAGLYYADNSGNFVIIASATDDAGIQDMHKLLLIMIFSFLASLVITFFLGRSFAKIALQPILKITRDLRIIRSVSLHKRLGITRYRNDEINQLSNAINNLLEHLEQTFKDQQSFITNASHELRTPLTKILGNAEVALNADRENEEYRATLNNVIAESEKLHALLNSLLELTQAGLDNSELQKINLHELLWEVADELENGGAAGEKMPGRLQVDYHAPASTGDYCIAGNRRMLFIALSNILKNALKFSGTSVVRCNIQSNANEVSVAIEDQGIGISAEEIPRIFQPFYRAGNARAQAGSGIGLSLAEKIIRLHNGTINVKSELNKGTLFTVSFPVQV